MEAAGPMAVMVVVLAMVVIQGVALVRAQREVLGMRALLVGVAEHLEGIQLEARIQGAEKSQGSTTNERALFS